MQSITKRLAGPIGKASALMEALPYLQAFRGKIFVIKTGGNALSLAGPRSSLLQDLIFLSMVGIKPVLIHGGGPEISKAMQSSGIRPTFVHGLRVTDPAALQVVSKTLRKTNRRLAEELHSYGAQVKKLDCGRKGSNIIKVTRNRVEGRDIGWVGKIQQIHTQKIHRLLGRGIIPVILPMGTDRQGRLYNVNADQAGSALAGSLGAEKFVLVTDVPGIYSNQKKKQGLIPTLTRSKALKLIQQGVIGAGMIPKTKACIEALQAGVHKTHMIDIRIPHGLLLEIFTFEGIGTEIVHDDA